MKLSISVSVMLQETSKTAFPSLTASRRRYVLTICHVYSHTSHRETSTATRNWNQSVSQSDRQTVDLYVTQEKRTPHESGGDNGLGMMNHFLVVSTCKLFNVTKHLVGANTNHGADYDA
jgi:hypothetical protein